MINEFLSGLAPDKIAICGDWHANRAFALGMIDSMHRHGVKVIVHCGDFGYKLKSNFLNDMQQTLEHYDMYVIWVDGNHEEFPKLLSFEIVDGVRALRPRVIHLPRGTRWQWNGKTYLGLGGANSIDKDYRVIGKSWWLEETISFNEAERVIQGGHADVMITHDCPSGVDIPGITKTSAHGWPEHAVRASEDHRDLLRAIVDEVKPKVLYHGHYHVRYKAWLQGHDYTTQVIGLDADIGQWKNNFIILEP